MVKAARWGGVLAGAVLAACGGSVATSESSEGSAGAVDAGSDEPTVPTSCAPGSVQACPCAGGESGTQTCNDFGIPLPCDCAEEVAPPTTDGGATDASVEAGPLPEPDVAYGSPCPDACPGSDCYVPGTGVNPICSRHCVIDADCGAGALCEESGGTGRWCFRRCAGDAECLAVNASADNPLYCASYSPPDAARWFCIQASEP